jgi:chromosome segregation ATPase
MTAESKKSKAEIKSLRTKSAAAQTSVESCNAEKRTMDSRLEDGALRLRTLQSVFDEDNSERRRLEQDRLAKELECSALSSNLEHLMEEMKARTEVATTSEILSQKMEQLESLRAEKDRLEEKLEYRESIKAAESDQIEALRFMLGHANNAVKTGDAEKYSMELLVQENASKLRILQNDFDSLNSERQCLEQDKIAKEHECYVLQSDLDQSANEIENVQSELAAASANLVRCRKRKKPRRMKFVRCGNNSHHEFLSWVDNRRRSVVCSLSCKRILQS